MRNHGSLLRLAAAILAMAVALLSGACSSQGGQPPDIVLVGATAKSADEIIRQALAAGHRVTGVARRPGDVTLRHPGLTVVQGDVYDRASLEAALVTGREVVITMVGPRIDPLNLQEVPASFDLFTTGTGNLIAAMEARGNRRLLVASSLGVEDRFPTAKPAGNDLRSQWLWNMRNVYRDMGAMEAMVRNSGLDYVIFRPAFLVAEPRRDDLLFAVDENAPKGRILTYADFAAFVLAQVRSNDHLGHTVGMYTERELRFGENVDFRKLAEEAASKARQAGPADASSATTTSP